MDAELIVASLILFAMSLVFGALRIYEVRNTHPQSRYCPYCGQVRAHAKFGRCYCPYCNREV
jgi:hypothetical protein